MSYYAEHNGLAKFWDHGDMGQMVGNYARYHENEIEFDPELFQIFVRKMIAAGIDINHSYLDNYKYNIEVYFDKINQMSNTDIDDITGVDTDA